MLIIGLFYLAPHKFISDIIAAAAVAVLSRIIILAIFVLIVCVYENY